MIYRDESYWRQVQLVYLSILFALIAGAGASFLYGAFSKIMFEMYGDHFKVSNSDLSSQKLVTGGACFILLTFTLPNIAIYSSSGLILATLWVMLLVLLGVMDLFFFVIPNVLLIILFLLEASIMLVGNELASTSLIQGVVSALVIVSILVLLRKIMAQRMREHDQNMILGQGDIKLFAVLAFFLGPASTLLTVALSSFFALIFMLPIRVAIKKQVLIPYGVFICLAAWVVQIFSLSKLITG